MVLLTTAAMVSADMHNELAMRCLSKTIYIGSSSGKAELSDLIEFLAKYVPRTAKLYEFNACVDNFDALISIQLTYLDSELGTAIPLERIGPFQGTCSTQQLESDGNIDKIRIFFDG